MNLDKDLQSIQEVRDLIVRAKTAQLKYQTYTQEQVDQLVEKLAIECEKYAEILAQMAVEETGYGKVEDKITKNLLGSRMTYDSIKDMKTVGIISDTVEKGITEIAVPMGIIAGLIPSTNPTSTTMYKTLIALKAGNAIIFSPHPGAKKCILKTVEIIRGVLRQESLEDLVGAISLTTAEATNSLIRHRDISMILATGGEAMVRAAYSSGNPAIGVGPGNGPAFIERTADIPQAVAHIIRSKTFDNGTICASEQSIITEECIEQEVIEQVRKQGGYFLNEVESQQVGEFLLRQNGTMNPRIVGKTAIQIAEMAGVAVPENTKVLLSKQTQVSKSNPYSREKLCPVLGFYVAEGWVQACKLCIEILYNEGVGHTMTIHSKDDDIIQEFALKKPVSRLLVNTPGSLGGVGVTTGLAKALTLGCGAVGGSATSDNITPLHLINIRRVARGIGETNLIKPVKDSDYNQMCKEIRLPKNLSSSLEENELEMITRAVMEKLQAYHR